MFIVYCLIALAALTIIALVAGFFHNLYLRRKVERGELDKMPEVKQVDQECCGQHETCEKESLLAAVSKQIEYYNDEELKKIVLRSADILSCRIDDEAASLLAHCSRGTPRIANRLLKRLRDFADVMKGGCIDTDIVRYGLDKLGIDSNGLEKQDRAILRTIIQFYQGGPVGADTLSISVGEAVETLEDFYEPYLIQQGYLKRTPRGRMVTRKAYDLLNIEYNGGSNDADQGLLF